MGIEMSDKAPSLCFSNVTLGYDQHPAVHHLDLDVAKGQLLAIVGPNGGGKSTLLKGVVGTVKPLEGKISSQTPVSHTAYLPQQSDIDRSFPISLIDMVAMGLWRRHGAYRGFSRSCHKEVEQAIGRIGLRGFEKRPIGTLSGGQLQRALFARLILQDADLILLDEPFAAIDSRTANDLISLVLEWHRAGKTILAVTHDLHQVREYFPTSLLLARELVAIGDTADVLSAENLLRARTLTEAFDDHAHVCERGHDHHEHDHDEVA